MQDTVITSWRRFSGGSRKHPDSGSTGSARTPPVQVKEEQQLETWEGEGGQSELSTEPARILIVDNDIASRLPTHQALAARESARCEAKAPRSHARSIKTTPANRRTPLRHAESLDGSNALLDENAPEVRR